MIADSRRSNKGLKMIEQAKQLKVKKCSYG
jgi:hypothetical protein